MSSFANAAPSTTKVVNFQGRLQTAAGAIVPDGYYNMQFKIYQGGSGNAVGNPGGTLNWTESHVNDSSNSGVRVENGLFSVSLGSETPFGSSVDWDQDSLWLSMNIAGSDPSCSTFGSSPCVADGEMLPMKRITAVPYAIAAGSVGGKSADDLVQLGQGIQTDASDNASIAINKTGSGNLVELQSSGTDAFKVTSSGSITMGSSSAQSISVADNATGPGQNLTISAGGSTSGDEAGGDLVLAAGSSSGTGSDGQIVMSSDVTIGAGKTITMVGGTTALRPASPDEGTVYFDTDTKKLLVYANGKWQADRSSTTVTVGTKASGGTSGAVASKSYDGADYVNDSTTSAQTVINAALASLPSSGGSVYLMEGTYVVDGSINIPNNTTFVGSGASTIIKVKNSHNSDINVVTNSDKATGTNINFQDFAINGNKANQTAGVQNGIYTLNLGGGSGSTSRDGAKITSLTIKDMRSDGLLLDRSHYSSVVNTTIRSNSKSGLRIYYANNVLATGNLVQANGEIGLDVFSGSYANLNGNKVLDNGTRGIAITSSSNDSVSDNVIKSSGSHGLTVAAVQSVVMSNNIISDSGASGAQLSSGDRIVFTGNTVHNSIGDAVEVRGNVNMSGNYLADTAGSQRAIGIYAANVSVILSQNTIGTGAEGVWNAAGPIYDGSTSGATYSNQRDASGKLINRSSGGFSVQNSAGSDAMTIDGTSGDISVAGTLKSGALQTPSLDTKTANPLSLAATNATSVTIGTSDANATTLVLDTKTSSGDPTGVNGAMYYNSSAGKFRCYQSGSWQDCVTPLPVYKTITTSQSFNDFALDVTGMSFPLAANTKYQYKFVIQHDGSNGAGFGITSPSGSTGTNWCINATVRSPLPAAGQSNTAYCGTGDASTVISNTALPGSKFVSIMEGYVETTATAGDLVLRAKSTLDGGTVTAGTFGVVQIVR